MFWDFTNTHPGDSVNNQVYYIRNLPSNPKGKVKIEITGIPESNYQLDVYKVGYNVNDPYTKYLSMNKPDQLTIQQVNEIKQQNNGFPIAKEKIKIDGKCNFITDIKINENDVYLLDFIKQ